MIKRAIILILILGGLYWLTTSLRNDPSETPKDETKVEKTTEKKDEDKKDTTEKKDETSEKTDEAVETKDVEADAPKTETKEIPKAEVKEAVVATTVKKDLSSEASAKDKTVSAPVTKPAPRVYYPDITTTVKVYLYEWAVDISQKEIPSGTVQFEVINNGRFSHDFNIKGVKNFGKVPPRQSANFSIKLLPGEFEIYSDKRDDYANGMAEGIVIVK